MITSQIGGLPIRQLNNVLSIGIKILVKDSEFSSYHLDHHLQNTTNRRGTATLLLRKEHMKAEVLPPYDILSIVVSNSPANANRRRDPESSDRSPAEIMLLPRLGHAGCARQQCLA